MTPFETLVKETAADQSVLFASPIFNDLFENKFDLHAYKCFLNNAYHHVKHTVPLLMACGARLPQCHSWMRDSIRAYIDEEIGHEVWIADDLEACGIPRAVTESSKANFATEVLVAYVYDYIERVNPIGFLGMVHVLEGTSISIASEAARLIKTHLNLPDAAFSYLTSHGDLDKEHVLFFEEIVNKFHDENDLDHVIHVAKRVYQLYGDVIRSVPRSASTATNTDAA